MVGKINNHEEDSAQVKRGDEKGMFEFGGSTIVVMTEPGMAEPDKDIIHGQTDHINPAAHITFCQTLIF